MLPLVQRLMLALDGLLRRRRRLVLVVWAVVLAASLPLAARQSDALTGGGFDAPGSQSAQVEEAIVRDFPRASGASLVAVLVPRGGARRGDVAAAVGAVTRAAARVDGVAADPAARRAALVRGRKQPGEPVLVGLRVAGGESAAIDAARELRVALGIRGGEPGRAGGGNVNVHLGGQGGLWAAFQEQAKEDVATAELRALPVIALVLLVAFGSLAAAALPLGLGFAAVIPTGAVIYGLSQWFEMSIYVTNVASMIGIGVAVDYSLFILARYRSEVRAGRSAAAARAAALQTSGVAVVFSGLTVIASIAGLFLLDATSLASMAVGAIVVVAFSVLAAATLLPVLMTLLGARVVRPGRVVRALASRRRRRRPAGEDPAGFWTRWTAAVMHRPVRSVLGASAVLLLLAAPALDLKMGNSGLRQLDADHELRDGVRAAASVTGPGGLGPVPVVAELARGGAGDPANRRALRELRAAVAGDPLVASVSLPLPAQDDRSALLTAVLRADPESAAARAGIERLRRDLAAAAGPRVAAVRVGGTTAALVDFDDLITGSMWKIFLFVLALSFCVLLVGLRSVVLPLKAVLMNLLSVAAAYGVLVAVFQWGWLEFLGLEPAPFVDTITPPLVLAIAFGLSMDYEVFLLTRIRERYAATGDTRRAVAEGLAGSARTITSAALIMVAVFLAFMSAGLPSVQRLGLATAVAVAVDATIVRLVLVPAAMELLGAWNWWLPRPLARVLPAARLEH